MEDELFDWDDANILHLSEHDVTPEEAEEIILGHPLDDGFELVDGEARWSYIGETSAERILRAVITVRGERMRVITAFEPSIRSRRLYLMEKAGGL